MLSGRLRFIRTAIVCLVAALTLGLPGQASAYLVATSGVEVVALPAGPSLWDLTIETDTAIGDAGIEVVGATGFTPADPPCAADLFCFELASAEGVGIGLVVFAVDALPANVDSPLLLGSLTGDVTSMRDLPDLPRCIGCGGFRDLIGATLPVTYLVVPEPSPALLLGVGIAALGLIRQRGSSGLGASI